MCTIIKFPVERTYTNGFLNLKKLFEECTKVESCNFYLDTVEKLADDEEITESEMFTLRRIGRQKRIELAHPKKEETAPIAAAPGVYNYCPEMGQKKPKGCQMRASLGYYGKHYYIYTFLELKGRGITFQDKSSNGENCYRVTKNAYEKLKAQYSIERKEYLD